MPDVPDEDALDVLEALAARRILRPGDDGRYEIYHDVLAAPILAWRARYVHAQALVAAHRRNRRLALVAAAAIGGARGHRADRSVRPRAAQQRPRRRPRRPRARARRGSRVGAPDRSRARRCCCARDSAVLSPTPTAEDVLRQALTSSRIRARRRRRHAAPRRGGRRRGRRHGCRRRQRRRRRQGLETDGDDRPACEERLDLRRRATCCSPAATAACASSPAARWSSCRESPARGEQRSPRAGRRRSCGSRARTGNTSPRVRLVDLRSGKTLLEVDHGAPVTAVALSGGGTLLATGGVDHVVRLWRVSNGSLLRVLKGHVGTITAIAFSTRGTLLATGAHRRPRAGLAHRATGRSVVGALRAHELPHGHRVQPGRDAGRHRELGPDGEDLEGGDGRGARDLRRRHRGGQLGAVHRAPGSEIVTASLDGTARTSTPSSSRSSPSSRSSARPSPMSASSATAARSRRPPAGAPTGSPLPRGPAVDIGPAATAANGGRGPRRAASHDPRQDRDVTRPDGTTVELVGHKAPITSIAFSRRRDPRRHGERRPRRADLGRAQRERRIQVLRGHFAIVSDARFSPDGRWVVTAGPGTAGLWSTSSGRLIYYLRGHEGKLLSAAFSPGRDADRDRRRRRHRAGRGGARSAVASTSSSRSPTRVWPAPGGCRRTRSALRYGL